MPDNALARLSPPLEIIKLSSCQMLCQTNEDLESFYFPINSIIALLGQTEDGNYTQTAMVGNDGLAGMPMLMGGHCPFCTMIQSAGRAFRSKVAPLNIEFDLIGAVTRLLLRYAQALIAQIAQTDSGLCPSPFPKTAVVPLVVTDPGLPCRVMNCWSHRNFSPACWEFAERGSP